MGMRNWLRLHKRMNYGHFSTMFQISQVLIRKWATKQSFCDTWKLTEAIINQFSIPQIEYPLRSSSKKCNHLYFMLQVFWIILLFCQIVLLFDINILMLPWWPHATRIQSDITIAVPWQLSTGIIHIYIFLLLPLSGYYSIWGTENYEVMSCKETK